MIQFFSTHSYIRQQSAAVGRWTTNLTNLTIRTVRTILTPLAILTILTLLTLLSPTHQAGPPAAVFA